MSYKSSRFDLGLAPMEGVTGLSTRLWFSMIGGVPAMTTPFLRATFSFPLNRLPPDYVTELDVVEGQRPYRLMPQVMTAAPEDFLRAARLLPPDQVIELNCGCPAPTSVGSGAGSALLRDPFSYRDFISKLCDTLGPGRLAIKMRLGLQSADQEFPRLFDVLAEKPLARLTIHGRTRGERYLGKSNWAWIEWAARHTQVPVYASGDILDESSLVQLQHQAPTIQGALIGRGALRNPWLFWQLQGGHQPLVSTDAMIVVLKCFVQLERVVAQISQGQLYPKHQDQKAKLQELCGLVWALGPSGTSLEQWRLSLAALTGWSADFPILGSEKFEKVILGRLKMIWNYLRSSVPLPLQDPALLRVTNLEGFWNGLTSRGQREVCYRPFYQPHWDWVYAGGGKQGGVPSVVSSGEAPTGI